MCDVVTPHIHGESESSGAECRPPIARVVNALYCRVMNTDLLARATFVVDRSTHEELGIISGRLGISRSALVRNILFEPVSMMAKWFDSVPPDTAMLSGEEVTVLHDRMQLDLIDFIERAVAEQGPADLGDQGDE